MDLPSDLTELILKRFDDLKLRKLLFYEPSVPEYVEDDGFQFEFRISPILRIKPILPAADPGRKTASGPFSFPEADFVVATVGPSHLLQLSKFCMFRPSLILHPIEFAEQTDDLNKCDFEAIWNVVNALGAEKQMVLYNCGVEAGASQGHKHMQILPRPGKEFRMFPDDVDLPKENTVCLPKIPFLHWIISIPDAANPTEVTRRYFNALQKTKHSLKTYSQSSAYSFIMTKQWMVLIPRTLKHRENVGANSAGMIGLVWMQSQDERDGWTKLGMLRHLTSLGIANNSEDEII